MQISEIKKRVRNIELTYDYDHSVEDYIVTVNLSTLAGLIDNMCNEVRKDNVIKKKLEERMNEYDATYRETGFSAAAIKARAFEEALAIVGSDNAVKNDWTAEEQFSNNAANWTTKELNNHVIQELTELCQVLCKLNRVGAKHNAVRESYTEIKEQYLEEIADTELCLAALKYQLSAYDLAYIQEWKVRKVKGTRID